MIKGRIALIEETLYQCHCFNRYPTCNVAIWKLGLRDEGMADNRLWQGAKLSTSHVLI